MKRLTKNDSILISVKVKPNAKKAQIISYDGTVLTLAVTAQAQDGKANQAVIELLSDVLDIPKRDIELHKGATSKQKIFLIKQATAWEKFVKDNSLLSVSLIVRNCRPN